MSHKPCENFKCKYEHQKLIERVKELENERKGDCESCPNYEKLIFQIDMNERSWERKVLELAEVNDQLIDKDKEILDLAQEVNNIAKNVLEENRKLKIALWLACTALAGSIVVLFNMLLGG